MATEGTSTPPDSLEAIQAFIDAPLRSPPPPSRPAPTPARSSTLPTAAFGSKSTGRTHGAATARASPSSSRTTRATSGSSAKQTSSSWSRSSTRGGSTTSSGSSSARFRASSTRSTSSTRSAARYAPTTNPQGAFASVGDTSAFSRRPRDLDRRDGRVACGNRGSSRPPAEDRVVSAGGRHRFHAGRPADAIFDGTKTSR